MTKRIFREGGPHQITHTGADQYSMKVTLPPGIDGRVARECPNAECSPGYFKVKSGTGITEGQVEAFCPYCRTSSKPSDFTTREQIRYAKDLLVSEARDGIDEMFKEALGIGPSGKRKLGGGFMSIEMSYKPGPKPLVHRPYEEEVRRDVTCPHCGLDHSVYGVAIWCADCGADILLTHIEAELRVVTLMLSDIGRRREQLGIRVESKDLENCLEDTVTVFEAVLRIMTKRFMSEREEPSEKIDRFFKKIGNAFQNIERAKAVFFEEFNMPLFEGFNEEDVEALSAIFQKRHPITHNLGVVDKKYIEQTRTAGREGREVLVTKAEIERAIDLSSALFRSVHTRFFSSSEGDTEQRYAADAVPLPIKR